MNRRIVKTEQNNATAKIFGSYDANLSILEEQFQVTLRNRSELSGDSIVIEGEDAERVAAAAKCIAYLNELSGKTDVINEQTVQYAIEMVLSGQEKELAELGDACICVTSRGKPVKAKTVGQKQYVESIRRNTIVLGVASSVRGRFWRWWKIRCRARSRGS